MKRLAVFLAPALLAACGGGGSGPILSPTTAPTQSPSYSAKLIFVSAMAGAQVQSDLRRAQSAAPMSASSPVPIMVVSAPESGIDSSSFGGQVEAEVSPAPASTPTVAFSNTNPNAVLVTPAPAATVSPLPAGVIAQAVVKGAASVQSQISGTASATIGAPVNQTPTASVYSYMSIALDANPGPGGIAGPGYTAHTGWKWTGSTWTPDDNSSDADIYIDSGATVYVPGGDTRVSTDTPFDSVTASQWANTETSFTIAQAITQNPDGSNNGLVIGKTRNGSATFKLFPNALGQGEGYFGAIEVSGNSIDGF